MACMETTRPSSRRCGWVNAVPRLMVGEVSTACPRAWPGRVAGVTFLGADLVAEVACDNGVSLRVRTRPAAFAPGDRVTVGIPDEAVWPIPDADEEERVATE